jgi:hypothetical protein
MWSSKKVTNKLFFKKYLNKVAVLTPLAASFRGADLSKIRANHAGLCEHLGTNKLSVMQLGYPWQKKYAALNDILIAAKILDILDNIGEFRLRVEYDSVGIYFNDDTGIDTLTSIIGIRIEETSEPFDDISKQFLLDNPRAIIRKEYSHKYKVTIKPLFKDGSDFKIWASKYDKLKLSSKNHYKYGGYFYVADDKMLSLCRLYLSDKLVKIEELVTISEIAPISNMA